MRTCRRTPERTRRGGTLVEFGLVLPILLLVTFGLIVIGLGVSRQQRLATMAREAARWASVHGKQYAKDTGNPAATAQDIYQNVIAPQATGFDVTALTYSVTWNTSNDTYHAVQDSNGNLKKVSNTVTVAVQYQWTPELFIKPITLSSSAVQTMSY